MTRIPLTPMILAAPQPSSSLQPAYAIHMPFQAQASLRKDIRAPQMLSFHTSFAAVVIGGFELPEPEMTQ